MWSMCCERSPARFWSSTDIRNTSGSSAWRLPTPGNFLGSPRSSPPSWTLKPKRLARYLAHMNAMGVLECRNPLPGGSPVHGNAQRALSLALDDGPQTSLSRPCRGGRRRHDPDDTFLAVANALTRNSGREKTGAFCYAVGWTHHTVGVQIIRAAAIIQGLLGNIGRPGGGILALRGHASIQGSTDIPTLYNMLPTYLPQPNVFHQHGTLQNYLDTVTPTTGWWANMPKYAVSLLKAWLRRPREAGQ